MSIDSKIKALIKQNGSITIDEMMSEVMSVNPSSYYQKKETFGYKGDFITAPEISQLFGETIALWALGQWYQMGRPSTTNIVELGPGQGVLMRDFLNVARLVPEFYQSLTIELIEINHNFIKEQKHNLRLVNLPIKHHDSIELIVKAPTIIIANEFFDAMPIKQYIKIYGLWYEVVLVVNTKCDNIKFDKKEISEELQGYLLQTHINASEGAIIEISHKSWEIGRFIAEHIMDFGGAALIIDYGYCVEPLNRQAAQYNSTLQAIKDHKYHPLLASLGDADLSAHVDFYALQSLMKSKGIKTSEVTSQRDFLIQNGILLRSTTLQDKLPASEAKIIAKQVDRLIATDKMGLLFKVLMCEKAI